LIGSTPIDMRKSIDGLLAIVEQELQENAYSGHLFVFVSRRCDRVKILAWDKGGFVLLYKRLELDLRELLTLLRDRLGDCWRTEDPTSERLGGGSFRSADCARWHATSRNVRRFRFARA
jgi:hypothetical protein